MNNLRYNDLGLIILRTTIGITFIFHSIPKIMGGIEQWTWLGEQLRFLGISFAPALFGFFATIAEFICGLLLTLGIWQRWSSITLLFVMIVALQYQLETGAGFSEWSHPLKMILVFLCLAISSHLPSLSHLLNHLSKKSS